MSEQSKAADDLIAELARLMAQDAGPEKKPESPAFALRIPGGPMGVPPTDATDEPYAAPVVADEPEEQPEPVLAEEVPLAAPEPEPEPYTAQPFRFDFNFSPRDAAGENLVPAPVPAEPAPPANDPTEDPIADLIEAEFASAYAPAEAVEPAVPETVVAEEVFKPTEAAVPEPEPVPAPRVIAAADQFRIAPVFGLGAAAKAATVTPVVNVPAGPPMPEKLAARLMGPGVSDPIDEIESLIGRAVQQGAPEPEAAPEVPAPAAPQPQARPAPAPAARSLATPTLKPPPQPTSSTASVDDTILAAAQATGARIDWVEGPEPAHPAPPPRRPSRRWHSSGRSFAFPRFVVGPLVALTLLVAAGFGLYWVLGSGGEPGPAPLLAASTEPVKEVPPPPEAGESPPQSVVFNEIAGGTPAEEEQLVSRDQADVTEIAAAPPVAPAEAEPAANRKVRTVTVRPDGTIVSGEDSLAGGAILPVARPNVPEVPGAITESPLLENAETAAPATGANGVAGAVTETATAEIAPNTAAPAAATDAAAAPVAPAAAVPETPATPPVQPGTYVAVVDPAGNPVPGKTAPVPMTKPQFSAEAIAAATTAAAQPQATSPVNALVQPSGNTLPPPPGTNLVAGAPASQPSAPAATTPAPAAPAAPAAGSGGSAPAYVQLASQRTEAEARASAQQIISRFGPLFNGASLEVQSVDLADRGIFYRVRVPANSREEANQICNNVKAAGGDCFTM